MSHLVKFVQSRIWTGCDGLIPQGSAIRIIVLVAVDVGTEIATALVTGCFALQITVRIIDTRCLFLFQANALSTSDDVKVIRRVAVDPSARGNVHCARSVAPCNVERDETAQICPSLHVQVSFVETFGHSGALDRHQESNQKQSDGHCAIRYAKTSR